MKAVIVDIRDNFAAALSDDGRIYKIKNNNYTIGQEIKIKKQILSNGFVKFAASAAAAIALLVVPAWAYYTPYSYVSIDINPSIEYSLNRFDRVLNVKAVNDDGDEILKEIDLKDQKNKSIEDAINEVLNEVIEKGYLTKEDGGVIVVTSSKSQEKSNELTSKLKSSVEEKVKKDAENSNVEVEAISVGEDRVLAARELGVTPGKLNLVQKLQERVGNPDDIKIEEWLHKPVKEIMKATKEYKKEEKPAYSYKNTDDEEDKDDDDEDDDEIKTANKEIKENKDIKENKQIKNKDNKDNKNNKDNKDKDNGNNNKDTKVYNNSKNNNNKIESNKDDDDDEIEEDDDEDNEDEDDEDEDDDDDKDGSAVEINNLDCTITSIDKKNNSITVVLSTQKTIKVYIDKNTIMQDSKNKNINISSLNINDKIKVDLIYKDEKFNATSLTAAANN